MTNSPATPTAMMHKPADATQNAALAAALHAMPDDPATHALLATWQQKATAAIQATIDKVSARLLAATLTASIPTAPTVSAVAATDAERLTQAASHARRQQTIARECRALAEEIVFSSLRHLHDPQWDPLTPTANAPMSGESILVSLLEMVPAQA
jgi:3-methyladenine DNA glycosylase/8-oxoguanine DNA glycosylase